MEKKPNIVLSGFMGTGKSAVGLRLAGRLGLEFIDMDSLIEKETGSTIKDFFTGHGEKRFREVESGVIEKLTSGGYGSGIVVSTGGGAVVDPANRERLKGWGVVVCLTASVDEIVDRVGRTGHRPLLQDANRKAMIERMLEQRAEAYRDSHLTLDTTGKDLDAVVRLIEDALVKAGVLKDG